jgi:hypothetical protein
MLLRFRGGGDYENQLFLKDGLGREMGVVVEQAGGRDRLSLASFANKHAKNRRLGNPFGEGDLVDVERVLGNIAKINFGFLCHGEYYVCKKLISMRGNIHHIAMPPKKSIVKELEKRQRRGSSRSSLYIARSTSTLRNIQERVSADIRTNIEGIRRAQQILNRGSTRLESGVLVVPSTRDMVAIRAGMEARQQRVKRLKRKRDEPEIIFWEDTNTNIGKPPPPPPPPGTGGGIAV